ncbi:hypothetical protein BGY98DRAFT_1092448 [Russula aff. rugulosa BPL654]|nr:hypothetical protein BGY98DRAFT_1092448 [Russula aff. rugulosa BPL654]
MNKPAPRWKSSPPSRKRSRRKSLVRHCRRPFSGCGARPPRWRLLQPTAPQDVTVEPAERTRDAREQPEDPIPVVPPMSFGFHHPSGEIHILDSGAWDACPGQDNPSDSCIVGDLNDNYFEGNENDHDGPYDGITMGC